MLQRVRSTRSSPAAARTPDLRRLPLQDREVSAVARPLRRERELLLDQLEVVVGREQRAHLLLLPLGLEAAGRVGEEPAREDAAVRLREDLLLEFDQLAEVRDVEAALRLGPAREDAAVAARRVDQDAVEGRRRDRLHRV